MSHIAWDMFQPHGHIRPRSEVSRGSCSRGREEKVLKDPGTPVLPFRGVEAENKTVAGGVPGQCVISVGVVHRKC